MANPKEAALQGLKKMKRLADMGLMQCVLPPHARPHIPTLKALGYTGSDRDIIAKAAQAAPEVLANVMAAAPMWTANAATIAPSSDAADGRLHFTPANLAAMFHRSIEHETTGRVLKAIFANEELFAHHLALPGGVHFGDEGAANHSRLCNDYGSNGLHLFVYGRKAFHKTAGPEKFPGRQTMEASAAIARLHGLDDGRVHYVQQNPIVIDAGAFHNDVVSVANKNVFFYHEQAFQNPAKLQEDLRALAPDIDLHFIEVPADEVPIGDAVKSYLFNSQLISVPGEDGMTLVLPVEAKETASTKAYLEKLIASNQPITKVEFLDVHQSMRNGGGPACLRLRVVMNDKERENLSANVILTDALFDELSAWVMRHYRDRLVAGDAVKSYLFNSQLISVPGEDGMTLVLPVEAKETASTKAYLEKLIASNQPITKVEFLDVHQSMRNGGGPACLRLRVVMNDKERENLSANVILTDALFDELSAWVMRHYRDRLAPDDLKDPALMEESFTALDALTGILKLGPVYEFQTG